MLPQEKIIETKICRHCNISFSITDKDLEFYEKVSPTFQSPLVKGGSDGREQGDFLKNPFIKDLGNGKVKYLLPTPTLCPDCRKQKRMNWWNVHNIYKRTCSLSKKDIFSMYPPSTKFPVYDYTLWWGDDWDAKDYGITYDPSKSFFEHIKILTESVPRFSKSVYKAENTEYTTNAGCVKNSFLVFNADFCEDCYYGVAVKDDKSCVDCLYVNRSEICYQCVDCDRCYNLKFSQQCIECKDSFYLLNCKNCSFCFGCTNLINKSYYIYNKSYTEETYFKELEKVKSQIGAISLKDSFFRDSIHPQYYNHLTERAVGNYLVQSKNIFQSFDVSEGENISYCDDIFTSTDLYDVYGFGNKLSLCYEGSVIGINSFHLLFCVDCWDNCSNLIYCQLCVQNCHFCFGCIGLKNASYCILNKQYTKEEYEILVPRIIEHMSAPLNGGGKSEAKGGGEWGEFFPSNIAPFGYNETVAMEYFPLTREEILNPSVETHCNASDSKPKNVETRFIASNNQNESGGLLHGPIFNWSDFEAPFPKVDKIIPAGKLPNDISKIPDDILNWAIECEITKKPFRIIKQELEFYRKHNLPIPHRHPDQRHLDRMNLRNPRKLWEKMCDKCGKNIQTTYAPDRPEKIYCEACYNSEIY